MAGRDWMDGKAHGHNPTPGPTTGPPMCGIGGIPGVCIGQVCMSVNLAAGGIFVFFS